MTEFVIGLPIYILIFSGLGMLHKYNNEGMIARMKTIRALSERTTAINDFEDFSPNSVGSIFVTGLGGVNFPGSGSDSIYVDSARKANIGAQFGTIKNPAAPPKSDIAAITGTTDSFANRLLDDRSLPIDEADGWVNIIRGVINLTGTNPSIGAGMRYSPIIAEESHEFSHPWTGRITYAPGAVDLPAPTAATHRAFSVAVSRLEMNRKEPYRSGMLEFNTDIVDGEMGVSGSLPAGSNLDPAMADDCANQATVYTDCAQDPAMQALADATSCGFMGWRQCTIADVCEGAEPDDACTEVAEGTDIFDSQQCDYQAGECARPSENPRSDNYDDIDFATY